MKQLKQELDRYQVVQIDFIMSKLINKFTNEQCNNRDIHKHIITKCLGEKNTKLYLQFNKGLND